MATAVTITRIEDGYSIAGASAYKNAIKGAVPSAKFDADTGCVIIGPRSLKKAEAAIATAGATIEHAQSAQPQPACAESFRASMMKKLDAYLVSTLDGLREAQEEGIEAYIAEESARAEVTKNCINWLKTQTAPEFWAEREKNTPFVGPLLRWFEKNAATEEVVVVTPSAAEQSLINAGGKFWVSADGKCSRVYFNDIKTLIDFEVEKYKTGNAKIATLAGKIITNRLAESIITELIYAKIWWEDGKFWCNTGLSAWIFESAVSAITAKIAHEAQNQNNKNDFENNQKNAGVIEKKQGDVAQPIPLSSAEEGLQGAAKSPKIGDHTHTVITVDDYDDQGNSLNVDIDILTIGINKATGIAIGCDQSGGLYFDRVRAGACRLDFAAEFGWVWANGVAGLPAHSRIGISPDMMELGMRHTAQYRAECALQKSKAKAYDDLQNEGCEGFNPYAR